MKGQIWGKSVDVLEWRVKSVLFFRQMEGMSRARAPFNYGLPV